MAASAQSCTRQFLLDYILLLHRILFDTDRKLTKIVKDNMRKKTFLQSTLKRKTSFSFGYVIKQMVNSLACTVQL